MADEITAMNDQELAHMHLGYNYDHPAIAAEFHRRHPRLEGWYNATEHLYQLHWDAWHEANPDADVLTAIGPDAPPFGWKALRNIYRTQVERIAGGSATATPDADPDL